MRSIIFCLPCAGLCNRMRVMASTLLLSEKLGSKRPVFFWLNNEELNCSFNSLFESFPAKVFEVRGRFLLKILPSLLCRLKWMKMIHERKDLPTEIFQLKGKDICVYTGTKFFPEADYSMFHLSSRLQSLLCLSIDEKTIGIHIRRTDNEKSIEYSPTELFIQTIEEEISKDPAVKFYLATDDPLEEKLIKEKFKERILVYEKRSLDRNNPLAIEDAVIDLANLSRCCKIYGSYWSSFSETAAQWGKIDYKLLTKDTV